MSEITPYDSSKPMSVRDTVKGIGIRAAVLGVGGLAVGGLLTAAMLKAAGTLVKVFVALLLLVTGASVAAWKLRGVRKPFDRDHDRI